MSAVVINIEPESQANAVLDGVISLAFEWAWPAFLFFAALTVWEAYRAFCDPPHRR